MKKRDNLLKTGLYAFVLLSLGIGSCGVSPTIFNNATVGKLHPCGIALSNLDTVTGTKYKDCAVAICTYEGENTAGYVYVWKSCKALLNSAAGMPNPDYEITGIIDPEAVAFDADSNLFISSPSGNAIHYINLKKLESSASTSQGQSAPGLDVSKLGMYNIPETLTSESTATYTDTYDAPRGLTFDADDGKLYVVMEDYIRTYVSPNTAPDTSSAVLQITNPASSNPTINTVSANFSDLDPGINTGQPNDVAQNCLDISYSQAHKCFFLTDLFNQRLHQLNWPKGQSIVNTNGENLAETNTAIIIPNNQYCVGVGLSVDPGSQDSIYCTSSDLNTVCQLNAYAYNQWNNYVNGTAPSSVRKLDAPTPAPGSQYEVGNFISWGVEVMPYLNADGKAILHGILVADAQQNKVVSFSTP
jgi:hypothetical protein